LRATNGFATREWSIHFVKIALLPREARLLCPFSGFWIFHRVFVNLERVHADLASFLVKPNIDVIEFVLAADFAEIGAREVEAFAL